MKPILTYDKSFIKALNTSEAILVENYFETNLTPVLLWELYSYLDKAPKNNSPQEPISILANKLPNINCMENGDFMRICKSELLYCGENPIDMSQNKILPAIEPQLTGEGTLYPLSIGEQELYNLQRNISTDYGELIAKSIKESKSINLNDLKDSLKKLFKETPIFNNLHDIVGFINKKLLMHDQEFILLSILEHFQFTKTDIGRILFTWNEKCKSIRKLLPIDQCFPYSLYIFKLNIFYQLALSQDKISSSKKAKTHIDLHYLYYLPFCNIFTSNDDFHKEVVPLFLTNKQKFIDSIKFKEDLRNINSFNDSLDLEEKNKYDYKSYPPDRKDSLICTLYDIYHPGWRRFANNPIKLSEELKKRIVEDVLNNSNKTFRAIKMLASKKEKLFD